MAAAGAGILLKAVIGIAALVVIGGVVYVTIGSPHVTPGQKSSVNVTQSTLRDWVSGQYGSSSLFTSNAKLHCILSQGSSLPSGLVLGDNCTVSGVHTLSPGTTKEISPPFTVIVNWTNAPAAVSYTFSIITVAEAPVLVPIEGSCTQGMRCNAQIASATNGTPPYYYTADTYRNGATPFGLTIGTDGYLTGTPTVNGTYTFGVCVVDSVGAQDCDQTSVDIAPATGESSTTTTAAGETSTWTAHITGVRMPEYVYYCWQGRVDVDYTLTFTAPAGYLEALQDKSEYGFENGTGTVDGTESVAAQCEPCINGYNASGDYCSVTKLNGGSASISDVNVDGALNNTGDGTGYITFGFSNYPGGYYSMNNYLIEFGNQSTYECLNTVLVNVTSYSPTQISGTTDLVGCGFGDADNISVVFTRS